MLLKLFKYKWERKHVTWFITVIAICLLLYSQIFAVRLGADLILVVFLLGSFLHAKPGQFIIDWLPPIFLFYVYEFVRGRAHLIADALNIPILVEQLIDLELTFFSINGQIPTVVLQEAMKPVLTEVYWYDYVLFFFYVSFFWLWIGVGYVIWLYKREMFKKYIYGFVCFALTTAVIYVFLPAAPPWYASNEGYLPPVEQVLWTEGGALRSNQLEFVSAYGHNPVAAFPSNHAGWPLFATMWLVLVFGWKRAGWTLVFPFVIGFATWYGAEHYIVDSIAGWLLASLFVYVSWNWDQIASATRQLYTETARSSPTGNAE